MAKCDDVYKTAILQIENAKKQFNDRDFDCLCGKDEIMGGAVGTSPFPQQIWTQQS
jgi:hypothetical protein